jgi:hypothetical protein
LLTIRVELDVVAAAFADFGPSIQESVALAPADGLSI